MRVPATLGARQQPKSQSNRTASDERLAQFIEFTLAEWQAFVLDDGPTATITHTYDPVGNRTVSNDGGVITTYAYDVANQLTTSIDSTGVQTTYTYDGVGNLVNEDVDGSITSYIFDGPNRLTAVYSPTAGDVTFLYDPDGRRVQKESSSESTNFVYDGERLLVEGVTKGTGAYIDDNGLFR